MFHRTALQIQEGLPSDGAARKAADSGETEVLSSAEEARTPAQDALTKDQPVAAETHFGKAWHSGTGALANLGITYDGDHDGDGIPDRAELSVGGSPLLSDTDADGLLDAFEFNAMAVLALNNADTDGNGVPDAVQDHDGDGLTAAQEQAAEILPVDPDTDADGLTDNLESTHGADALAADTDGDTLPDGAEVRGSTDPTNPDTDSDGVSDADELLAVRVQGPDGLSAVVTGADPSALGARISAVPAEDTRTGAAGRLGGAFEFGSPGDGMVTAELVPSVPTLEC